MSVLRFTRMNVTIYREWSCSKSQPQDRRGSAAAHLRFLTPHQRFRSHPPRTGCGGPIFGFAARARGLRPAPGRDTSGPDPTPSGLSPSWAGTTPMRPRRPTPCVHTRRCRTAARPDLPSRVSDSPSLAAFAHTRGTIAPLAGGCCRPPPDRRSLPHLCALETYGPSCPRPASSSGLLATWTVKSARPAVRTRARLRSTLERSSQGWW
jgi:hypothetical protein